MEMTRIVDTNNYCRLMRMANNVFQLSVLNLNELSEVRFSSYFICLRLPFQRDEIFAPPDACSVDTALPWNIPRLGVRG